MTEPISYPAGMRHPEHSGLRLLWAKSFRLQVLWKWVTELQNHGFAKATSVASKFLSLDQKCSKLSSAQRSIPSSDPEQWLWEGSTSVFNLLFSRKYGQKMDREIQTTPVSSLSTPGWGEQTIPVLQHNCYHFGKEMQAGNASQKRPLTSSILHFLHSTWNLRILPHLSSPRPTFVFLNSTPNPLESKCIPSAFHSKWSKGCSQGYSLPTLSFTPDYAWTTTLWLLPFLVPKEEDCVLKAVY